MLPLLIIFLSVCSIVGAVLWIRPSQRDRQRATLRQAAFSQHLFVRQMDFKWPRVLRLRTHRDSIPVLAYGIPLGLPQAAIESRRPWLLVNQQALQPEFEFNNKVQGEDWWLDEDQSPLNGGQHRDKSAGQALLNSAAQLDWPLSVVALQATQRELICYWQERGEAEVVSQLVEQLKSVDAQFNA